MDDARAQIHTALSEALRCDEKRLPAALDILLTDECVFDISAPVERLEGRQAVAEGFFGALRSSFVQVRRRDEIFIGGPNRRGRGETWMAAVAHYVGTFDERFAGVAPSGRLAFLRSGEFYRIEGGRIAQARIILDLPDLMRQTGRPPFPQMLGTEMLFPGPATHDGVCPATGDGARSLDIVEAMLADLHAFDPATYESKDQTGPRGYWHPDMLWYGPGGIGSTYRWDGFVKDHRAPFLSAFPDRKGGNHYCRIGDGDYAAVSGWPSMTMTHAGDYLGVAATGKPLTLRVMDFYRCESGRIIENWVLLDYVDLFRQKGVDLLAAAAP
ncbi:MAG: ester cyclase [Paracoccaceae bacterium]|nr:ester cyclase [Paracoccaceae bacterium]